MSAPRCAAVIVAAGASRRMGFNKLFAPLRGRPVLRWSVDAFAATSEIGAILVVHTPGRREEFSAALQGCPRAWALVEGGAERVDSVLAGLAQAAGFEFSAVHDAARPLVTPGIIASCIAAAADWDATVCAEPVTDTLHRADGNGVLRETVSRENLWRMQTPQVARTRYLEEALRSAVAADQAVTDEISAILAAGGRAKVIANEDENFKLTFPRDLLRAERVLAER